MTEQCPVCMTDMAHREDHLDQYQGMGTTTEESYDCPNGCYHYDFAYGSARTTFVIHSQRVSIDVHYSDCDHWPGLSLGQAMAIQLLTQIAHDAFMEDLASANQVLKQYASMFPSPVQSEVAVGD